MRAYPQGEAGGDSGYQATAELRYQTPVKGMSMTLFADVGEVWHERTEIPPIRIAGWQVGVLAQFIAWIAACTQDWIMHAR